MHFHINIYKHEEFKEELRELRKVFEKAGVSALFVINVQQKMSSWWRKHIRELDRDLGGFLIESSK